MKKCLLILGFISITGLISAQESTDYGVFLGMAQEHAQTIIPIPKGGVNPAVGAFYRYNLNPRYGLRGGVNYLVSPTPSLASLDLHGLFEFNFLPLNPTREKPKVSTFVAAGVGWYANDLVMPFHLGVKYWATEKWGLSFEWKLRRQLSTPVVDLTTFVPESNWYSLVGVTASYNIVKTCKTCPFYESNRKRK